MLDTFIKKGGSKAQRRARAVLSLAIFPAALVASVIVGTLLHFYDFIREFIADLKELVVNDIPDAVTALVRAVKTGEVTRG